MIRHNVCKAHAIYFIVFTFYSKIYVEKLFHICKANRILKICFCYTNLSSVKFMRQCINIDCQYTGLRNTKTSQCQWNPCIVSLLVLWWRHGMETKSGLLAICDSNLLVMDSPHKGLFSRWFDLSSHMFQNSAFSTGEIHQCVLRVSRGHCAYLMGYPA